MIPKQPEPISTLILHYRLTIKLILTHPKFKRARRDGLADLVTRSISPRGMVSQTSTQIGDKLNARFCLSGQSGGDEAWEDDSPTHSLPFAKPLKLAVYNRVDFLTLAS